MLNLHRNSEGKASQAAKPLLSIRSRLAVILGANAFHLVVEFHVEAIVSQPLGATRWSNQTPLTHLPPDL